MMRVKSTADASSAQPRYTPPVLKGFSKSAMAVAYALTLLGGLAGSAQAALVNKEGDDFWFSYDDALVGLYGTPVVTGNTVFFQPTDFYSWSYSSPSLTRSTINLIVTPKNGHGVDSLSLDERGDYFLDAAPGNARVSVLGSLRVFNSATPGIQMVGNIQTGALNQFGGSLQEWNGSAFLDMAKGTVETHGALHVTIENLLRASVMPGAGLNFGPEAFIEKKYVALTVSPAPEAEQWALMLVGLGLIGMVAMRRRTDDRVG